MKKSQKKSFLKLYQPNPTEPKTRSTKGDCAIRCVAAALNVDWLTSFDILSATARSMYSAMCWPDVMDMVLINEGFIRHVVKREAGSKAPTPAYMAQTYPDRVIVCRVANHFTCVRDGQIWDTWDCGDKTIYTYWMKD